MTKSFKSNPQFTPTPTTPHSRPPLAVVVRNASKCYQDGKLVLDGLSMSVKVGTIYGLLGASGCGKTTIISCILGLIKLNKGSIKVLGGEPGSGESVPGFMPQELAIHQILRIQEVLQYYGRITNMTTNAVKSRIKFLLEFLELPDQKILVQGLSGGQKRRLSLAVAMLHSPELLILDEPTVGVDPLLRLSIWDHLQELVRKQRTTIILTSHYIEEAKQADQVGIMRNGRLLVESKPSTLLAEYNTLFLEEVFLQLCSKDEEEIQIPKINGVRIEEEQPKEHWSKSTIDTESPSKISSSSSSNEISDTATRHVLLRKYTNHFNKIKGVVCKNLLSFIRISMYGCMLMVLPPFQILMFLEFLGHEPSHIPLGIVNHELQLPPELATHPDTYCSHSHHGGEGCFTPGTTSCRFLKAFSTEDVEWVKVAFNTEQEALLSVAAGSTIGYLCIPQNYTQHMLDRFVFKFHMGNDTMEGSTIRSRLDISYSLKSDFVKAKTYLALEKMVASLATSCNADPRLAETPLKVKAIYGDLNPSFHSFMQPGLIILSLFFIPMASSIWAIQERKEYTAQRAAVSGLCYPHIIIGFMMTEGLLLTVQVALIYGLLWIGGLIMLGSLWEALGLMYLMGFVGLGMGFLIGESVDSVVEANFMILAIYIPTMSSSGALWDDITLPYWLRIIVRFANPASIPTHSLRAIFNKGWGIYHPTVFSGFACEICWIICLFGMSGIVRKIRSH